MSENKKFKEFRTQLNENEYSEVLTGYPNRSVAPCGAIKFDADMMNRANAMLNAISRSTFMHPNEAFIRIKTRLNLMMLDFPWTPYLWSDSGTGNVTLTVTRYGRVDGVDALTGAIRMDGKANSPDGFMEFILSVGIDIGEDGLYRVTPQLSRKEDVVVEEEVEAEGQELTEGGVKGALEDYMYSIPKSAIPELKEAMKMKPGTAKMGKITKVLRKHGFSERFMGSTPSNVVNDYFDTFYGDVNEASKKPLTPWFITPPKKTVLTQKVVKGKKVGSPRPIAKYDPKAEAERKAKEMKEQAEQIEEAGIQRLKRIVGASYKAYIKRDDKKHAKMAKLAGDLTNKIERAHARRGGATPEVAQQDTPVDKEKGKVTRASSKRYQKRTAIIRKFRNKGTAKRIAAPYMSEELVGKQKKLDVNKNKRLDSQDFTLLRAKKKAVKETYPDFQGGIPLAVPHPSQSIADQSGKGKKKIIRKNTK
jgi:hypothetical protein